MKVEIINKPMLCWDNDENTAEEWHVLAKVTECDSVYPFKVVSTKNTFSTHPGAMRTDGFWGGRRVSGFKNVKPLSETIEMTVAEISKVLGKTVKIVE